MIAAVTFDADGTLWDFERVMRESLGLALDTLRARVPGRADGLTVERLAEIRDEVAVGEAGCEPGQIVHVGDSLVSDVAGARAAGIRAVWLNRERLPNTSGIVPDAEIMSLSELPALCR